MESIALCTFFSGLTDARDGIEQGEILDLVPERVVEQRMDGVVAAQHTRLLNLITRGIDHVGVVAVAADEQVGAAAAIEQVIVVTAVEDVVAIVAEKLIVTIEAINRAAV